jgi:hypothetical protein
MLKRLSVLTVACVVAALPLKTASADEPLVDMSLKLESLSAVEGGVSYLVANQKKDGSFSDHPGITAVSAIALKRYLTALGADDPKATKAIAKARVFILSKINGKGLITEDLKEDVYSTSVCLMALAFINDPRDAKVMKTLRTKLISNQIKKAGGFAYGRGSQRSLNHGYPDLSNSQWALEAVSITYEESERNRVLTMARKLRTFIGTCQVKDPKNPKMDGGFLYYPMTSQPKKTDYKNTRVVWGSLTMGALKSLRFSRTEADAKEVDERIAKGLKWVSANYDLSKNPGLKQGGWYYYAYMFSSAMVVLKKDFVTMPDGTKRSWRSELLEKLMSKQKGGDHWVNANPLWMENDSNLCTAYALNAAFLALTERKRPKK